MDIEIKNKRNLANRILEAIFYGKNVVYNGRYVVNHIGATTYIDYDFIRALDKKTIEQIFLKDLE